MSNTEEDPVLKYLQSYWIVKFFKSRCQIDKDYFEGNPNFSIAAQSIANVSGSIQHSQFFAAENLYAEIPFLNMSGYKRFLIITPKRYWSLSNGNYSSGETGRITIEHFDYEEEVMSADEKDEIIEETWEHPTKSGERDFRYKDNAKIYFVRRYGVTLNLENESTWRLAGLRKPDSIILYTEFHSLLGVEYNLNEIEFDESEEDTSEENEEAWYDVLGVPSNADKDEIKTAYREKIKQYHPDRVSGLGDKLKAVAEQESRRLNAAKNEGLAGK